MSLKRVHARLPRAMATSGPISPHAIPHIASLMRASVTGLEESIPFRVIHSPDTCFCTGSAQGRRLMGCVEDRPANLRMRGRVPHPAWRPDLIHRPGEGTSRREGLVPWPARELSRSLLLCGRRHDLGLGRVVERLSVGQHAMQDDRELARERHLGLAHAGAAGDPHRPALEL